MRLSLPLLYIVFVAFTVYFVTKSDHQLLACVAVFIFLRQVFTPDIEMSIFYWYTEVDHVSVCWFFVAASFPLILINMFHVCATYQPR